MEQQNNLTDLFVWQHLKQNRDIKARIGSKRDTLKQEMLLRKREQGEDSHSARPDVESVGSGNVGFGDEFFVPE